RTPPPTAPHHDPTTAPPPPTQDSKPAMAPQCVRYIKRSFEHAQDGAKKPVRRQRRAREDRMGRLLGPRVVSWSGDLGQLLAGLGQALLGELGAHVQTLGMDELHVMDADEAQGLAQVGLLVVQAAAGIDAT